MTWMPETLKILHLGQDDVVWLVMVDMTKSEITSETTRTAGTIKFDFRTGPGPLRDRLPLLAMRLGRYKCRKFTSGQKRDRTVVSIIRKECPHLRPLEGRFGCCQCCP